MGDTNPFCWRCAAPLASVPPVRCEACGEMHYNNPRPAAEAVVISDGQGLLIRRARDPWKGAWDIPGGFLEAGEDPAAAAERELLEETGLSGRAVELLGVWSDRYGPPSADGIQITTLNVAYLVELETTERVLEPDHEALEARWLPVIDPPAELAFPDHALQVLKAAAAYL